ncbi:superoxide dismutase family protein [Streptomyces sp. NPDC051940]|uniref:superoxide dismutase family protein n=1 Tax=Streptomyces sp. NPDC051940 TaxID=3155675 RepID=UPI00342C0EC1
MRTATSPRTATPPRTAAALAVAAATAATLLAAPPAAADSVSIMVRTARFAPPTAFVPSDAVTYDLDLVPAGAQVAVAEVATDRKTVVRIGVAGLRPSRAYGVHVHTAPCGTGPGDSGPHYQNVPDPVQPSVDPAYANARNEVWLDFTTDPQGRGTAETAHAWRFRAGEARSIVIHAESTATEPGHAGTAGDRVACYSVPLR